MVDPADFIDLIMKPDSTIYDSMQCIAWQLVVDIGDCFYLTKPNPSCTSVSELNTLTFISSLSTKSVAPSVVIPPTFTTFEGGNPLMTGRAAIPHSKGVVLTIDASSTSIDAPQLVSKGVAMSTSSIPVTTS